MQLHGRACTMLFTIGLGSSRGGSALELEFGILVWWLYRCGRDVCAVAAPDERVDVLHVALYGQ